MGSHSVTHLNPSQTGRYSIYLPCRDRRLSWPRWLVTYRDDLPACRRSPIQVLTRQCTAGSRTCNLLITCPTFKPLDRQATCSCCCSCDLVSDDDIQKRLRLRRFSCDRDEIWQDCSSSKYASIDWVRFLIWCYTLNMATMTSFHAEKCCRLVSEASAWHTCSSIRQFLIQSPFVLVNFMFILCLFYILAVLIV